MQKSIYDLKATCQSMRVDNVDRFLEAHKNLMERLKAQVSNLTILSNDKRRYISPPQLTSLDKDGIKNLGGLVKTYPQTADDLSLHVVEASKFSPKLIKILESLRFTEMPHRHDSIREAHGNTYSWIFDKNASPLADWLAHRDNLFLGEWKGGFGQINIFQASCTR
ncbi:hypothetical protein M426DRAFT_137605 [Hypoxylon sp. CI-4A]|nr:hypothetical protein M426DRAFT_137605 [Hypoxylon sp. CI-4A]